MQTHIEPRCLLRKEEECSSLFAHQAPGLTAWLPFYILNARDTEGSLGLGPTGCASLVSGPVGLLLFPFPSEKVGAVWHGCSWPQVRPQVARIPDQRPQPLPLGLPHFPNPLLRWVTSRSLGGRTRKTWPRTNRETGHLLLSASRDRHAEIRAASHISGVHVKYLELVIGSAGFLQIQAKKKLKRVGRNICSQASPSQGSTVTGTTLISKSWRSIQWHLVRYSGAQL